MAEHPELGIDISKRDEIVNNHQSPLLSVAQTGGIQ